MRIAPLFNGQIPHFHNSNGNLANGFKLYFYLQNSDTPATVYKDEEGNVPYTNPIVLDARGETETQVFVDTCLVYKMVLKDRKGCVVWSEDNVTASAHVPNTLPFAIDEEHFKIEMVGGVAVLSLADSLVSKLKAKGVDIE